MENNYTVNKGCVPVFFLICASNSMLGSKMHVINQAMEELLPELIDLSDTNDNTSIDIAIMKICSDAEWITQGLESLHTGYSFPEIIAGGRRNVGQAFRSLNEALHRKAFLDQSVKYFRPIVFLVIDGISADDYHEGLQALENNRWFNNSIRIGVAMGELADRQLLEEFSGKKENVISNYTPESLKRWITIEDME